MKFSQTPLDTTQPAPCFGEHNHYIFGELLGLSDQELADLTQSGIISDHPLAPMGE